MTNQKENRVADNCNAVLVRSEADLKARKDAANILLWPISKSARDKNSNLAQTEGWY